MGDINGQEFMGSSGQKSPVRRGRLQVSKVGPSFNWQAFQTHLESYGHIIKTTSQTDDDDQSLLTCFVEFTDSNNARRAADDLNGIDFDGSRLELAYFEDDSLPMYDDTTKQRNRQGGRNRRWNRQNSHANMPLRILIPGDMVGAVIGKGGETVRKMSNNTNARIDVHRTVNINGFKPVTITGQTDRPAENCSAAFREIHQKLIEEADKKAEGDEPISVPMRMLAPDLLMGRVIGKGGRNLKDIKVKTGTKIDATRDPVTPVFNERIITIEDSSLENPVEKCSNAEEEISRILRKSYQDDLNNMANMNGRMAQNPIGPFSNPYIMAMIASLAGGRGFNGMPPPYMGNGMNPGGFMSAGGGMHSPSGHGAGSQKIEKIHIAVPRNAVGAIIGREGSVVNGIRHASGASVQVLKSDEDAVETLVELRGYPHQLTMAEGAIFQKIQEQGFAGHPNQTVQLRTEIKIPPEAVGRIIGRGGAKVRSLQGRHRALVEVPRSVSPDETEVIVRVLSDYLGSQGVQTEIREIVAQVEAQQRK